MLNQVILCGRLSDDPQTKELEDGRKHVYITLAIPRNYKNAEGVYDTDFIKCTLWYGIAENVKEYCKKGDLLGIRGRIQTTDDNSIQIIGEKVSYLSSKREDKENE